MDKTTVDFLKKRLDDSNYKKLSAINNPSLYEFIARYIEICDPDRVFVNDDSIEAVNYIKRAAIANGEEGNLAIKNHVYHFDAAGDQGRDKENTRILVPENMNLGSAISTLEREKGLKEVHNVLKDIMKGRELYISFFCLGPANSQFTIPCVQLTDSSYVAHNEILLYRPGYDEFVRRGTDGGFFRFVHSQGEFDDRKVCVNLDKRRIYIDIADNIVFSANTQYGGNSIGLKKLAMRLAIYQASQEDWLTEHMLVLGIAGVDGRITYFTGAYPSLCGKTSTAMIEGERIIGDDIAYLRKKDGIVRAVNVESGIFGIMDGVNPKDDPVLWKALHSDGEVIFSNVLVTDDGDVFWTGKSDKIPQKGKNYSGEWHIGKKNQKGLDIPPSHPNSRFTLNLSSLDNCDRRLNDPAGVEIGGVVYGGRDSDTCVPVEEAFDWIHGIITKGASLESETTAATLGKEGVREINPMANLDFLSVTIGKYIQMNLDFGKGLKKTPLIFSVNYFLRDKDGRFMNERGDKKVWFEWMDLRVHGEANAVETPTGRIPLYQDLKRLFRDTLNKDYTEAEYIKQFTIRIPENLSKIERIKTFYKQQFDVNEMLFKVLDEQADRLLKAKEKYGDYISPFTLAER
ncbi:MAG: phosphoenolpyruvate carboxykinase (GTP) [Nitrospirae bacterium]|nr:phosphoenolpyruvate carboxykinase (GTP) [Nitrospirota bacterium]